MAEARGVVEGLRAEQIEDRDAIRDLIRRTEARAKVINGYEELFPGLSEEDTVAPPPAPAIPAVQPPDAPRGQRAVWQVMREQPATWLTLDEILEELAKRGWMPNSTNPAAAVRAALQRLTGSQFHSIQKGRLGGPGASRVVWSFRPGTIFTLNDYDEIRSLDQAYSGYEPDDEEFEQMRSAAEEAEAHDYALDQAEAFQLADLAEGEPF